MLNKNLEKLVGEFWNMDCLIRVIKGLLSNDNQEKQEEDIGIMCNILVKTSNTVAEQVKNLQMQLQLNKQGCIFIKMR